MVSLIKDYITMTCRQTVSLIKGYIPITCRQTVSLIKDCITMTCRYKMVSLIKEYITMNGRQPDAITQTQKKTYRNTNRLTICFFFIQIPDILFSLAKKLQNLIWRDNN